MKRSLSLRMSILITAILMTVCFSVWKGMQQTERMSSKSQGCNDENWGSPFHDDTYFNQSETQMSSTKEKTALVSNINSMLDIVAESIEIIAALDCARSDLLSRFYRSMETNAIAALQAKGQHQFFDMKDYANKLEGEIKTLKSLIESMKLDIEAIKTHQVFLSTNQPPESGQVLRAEF